MVKKKQKTKKTEFVNVYRYFEQYILSSNKLTLKTFLTFVTGSPVYPNFVSVKNHVQKLCDIFLTQKFLKLNFLQINLNLSLDSQKISHRGSYCFGDNDPFSKNVNWAKLVAAVRFSTIVTFCQLSKVFYINSDWHCHFLMLSTLTMAKIDKCSQSIPVNCANWWLTIKQKTLLIFFCFNFSKPPFGSWNKIFF